MHITILIPMQTLHAYIPYLTCIAITPNTHAYHYPHIPITTFLSLHHAMHPVSSHLSMAMHDHILPISIPIVKPTSLSLKLHSYPFSEHTPHHPESKAKKQGKMLHRTQPMIGLLVFTGINVVLASTIALVYDFVCFLPYWERRRERRHQEREAFLVHSQST